jgi:prepilin-type N-terminal cleavage/methylation domain-containing protein
MKSRRNAFKSGFTLIEVIVTLVVLAIVAAMMTSYFGTSITQSSVPISRLKTSARLQETMQIITAQYIKSPHWHPNTIYAANTIILPTTSKRTGLQYITNSGGTSGSTEPTWLVTGAITDGSATWTPYATAPAAPTLINQAWRPSKPYSVNTIIVNGSNQYITPNGGTSGTTQPTWALATTIGSTVPPPVPPDGITWKCSGNSSPTVILQTLIGAEGTNQTQTFGSNPEVSYRVIDNRFIKFTGNVEQNAVPDDSQYGMYLKVTIGHRSDASDRTAETVTTLFAIR